MTLLKRRDFFKTTIGVGVGLSGLGGLPLFAAEPTRVRRTPRSSAGGLAAKHGLFICSRSSRPSTKRHPWDCIILRPVQAGP